MFRSALRRAHFTLWSIRLRLALRRRGGRLVLDAPAGARLKSFPRLQLSSRGEGDGTFHLRIGPNVTLEHGICLRIDARGSNVLDIGDNTLIQADSRLWLFSGTLRIGRNTILRDGVTLKTSGTLDIGEYVRINSGTVVHCQELIELADRVGIADHGVLVDSDHPHDGTDTWFMSKPGVPAPIHLGRNVMIAANCVITRGVRVGPNSLVAAGAVVLTGEYPAGWIIGGVPAKPLRALQADNEGQ